MSSSAGTKVTTDPESKQNPKNENPGTVTSDSLAGESITSGGSFAANSDARGVSGASSASTTTNTTDASGATKLDSAPSAAQRQGGSTDDAAGLNAGGGPSYASSGSGGGSGASSRGAAHSAAGSGVSGNTSSSYSDAAGGSAAASGGVRGAAAGLSDTSHSGPHGKSLQEGGFDSGAPNASFNNEVGTENDPARVALGGMQEADVPQAGVQGGRENEVSADGQFDALGETDA